MSFRDRSMLEMKVPLTWTAGVAVLIAIVVGVALLFGDRRETLKAEAYSATKAFVDTASAPVNGVLAAPGRAAGDAVGAVRDYVLAGSQNRGLREQIIELERWRDKAIALQNENARLRAVLGLNTDPPIPMAAAHVIADFRGPFSNTRLADAGSEQGIVIGNPVMSERGLVGRVVGVGHGVSRVLLLTDVVSRTPVLVDRTNARAILTGDGSSDPKLAYLRGQDPVKVGDRILTSGDGGLIPRGLPVGEAVRGLDGVWRVRLDSDSEPIDFVRVLKFRDFSQLAEQKALSASVMPQLPPRQAAEVAAAEQPATPPPQSAAVPTGLASIVPPTTKPALPSPAAKPALARKPAPATGHDFAAAAAASPNQPAKPKPVAEPAASASPAASEPDQ